MKHTPLPRPTKPMRKRNPERRARDFARCFHSDDFVQFTHASPSVISGRYGCVCSHSACSRGAGGTAQDVVPITKDEHDEEHRIGRATFWRKHGKDARVEAAAHWARFLESVATTARSSVCSVAAHLHVAGLR